MSLHIIFLVPTNIETSEFQPYVQNKNDDEENNATTDVVTEMMTEK